MIKKIDNLTITSVDLNNRTFTLSNGTTIKWVKFYSDEFINKYFFWGPNVTLKAAQAKTLFFNNGTELNSDTIIKLIPQGIFESNAICGLGIRGPVLSGSANGYTGIEITETKKIDPSRI